VLITCDTLRADHLGFLGCPRGTSPNLDALARDALVFEAAWSTAPLTGPALSALLTGRPPEELGLEDNRNVLAAEALTLAERLADAGFDTAAIVSNWVLRARPELPDAGVRQGFAHFDDRMESREASRPDLKERLAPATTDAALAWLDARERDAPFFLWVHYQDPHGPYTAPALLVDACGIDASEPALAVGTDQRGQGVLPAYQVVDDERRPAAYRARYDAEIRFFDRELGRLVDGLRARGILERALVAFTADHGESLGERGWYFSHGQHLHQELVRVPLVVRPPGGAGADGEPRRVTAPASHLDLYPTVLAFLGLDPGRVHGTDLLAGMLPDERVLPQYLRGTWSATGARHRLVVERGARRLYDLDADPEESLDIAGEHPEVVRALVAAHREFVRAPGLPPLAAARPELDAEAERALDALGYGGEDDDGH
jgi:arylsulfatase